MSATVINTPAPAEKPQAETATTPAVAATTPSSKRDALMALKIPELKAKAKAANVKVTGNKGQLVDRLLDPTTCQKKAPAAPKKKIAKKVPKKASMPKLGGYGLGAYGGYGGYDDSEDEGEGEEMDFCEACDRGFPRGEWGSDVDPHNGLCGDCFEAVRPADGCSCWRMTCEYSEEMECFACDC
jgi:hypothetical protein